MTASTETTLLPPRELVPIVQSVFESMMNLDVELSETQWFACDDRISAAIHLSGSWNGALLIECCQSTARELASRFLSMEPEEVVADDICDVLGELANMIAGNLKSLLASGTTLSTPTVVNGGDYSVRVCGVHVQDRLSFSCVNSQLWITILAANDNPAEGAN